MSAWLCLNASAKADGTLAAPLTAEEAQWVQDHKRIRVGIMADWPPFNKVNTQGRSDGISAEIIQAIGKHTGLEIELVPGAWKDIYPQLVDKKIDALMDVTPKPAREPLMNFTSAYLTIPHAIIATRDAKRLNSENDLAGMTIALEKGFGNVKWFQDNHPEVNIREYPTTRDCLDAVARGEAEAYVGNRAVATYIMTQEVMHNLSVHGRLTRAPTILAIGARKDAPILRDILQKGLDGIDGPHKQEILTRWTGTPVMDNPVQIQIELTDAERLWLRDHPVITAANELDWPPFDFVDAGRPRGMSIDVLNLIAEKAGVQVKYVNGYTWAELLERFNQGKIDVLPALYWTDERAKTIDYTSPYASNASVLALRNDHPGWKTLDALKGRKVGVIEGFATAQLLEKRFPEIELVPVRNVLDGLQKVSFGEIDAFFDSLGVVAYTLDTNVVPNITLSLDPGLKTGSETELRMGVLKTTPHLRNILQKGLDAITTQEMRDLRGHWIPVADVVGEGANAQAARDIVIEQNEKPLLALIAVAVIIFVSLFVLARILLRSAKLDTVAMHMGSTRMRIGVIGLLGMLVVLVSAISWFAYEYNRSRILEVVGGNLRTVLSSTAERLEIWTEDQKDGLAALGQDPQLISMTRSLLTLPQDRQPLQFSKALQNIRTFFRDHPFMASSQGFFIITPEGISIGSRRDKNLATQNLIAQNMPDLFARVLQGESVFVPAMRSDVHLSGSERKGQLPYTMFFAAPIKDQQGQVLGVLTKRIDPTDTFSKILQSGRTGDTGETYAFNADAVMMSSSRFEAELMQAGIIDPGESSVMNVAIRMPVGSAHSKGEGAPLTRMAQSALKGNAGLDLNGYPDYRGNQVFGAWIWAENINLGFATEIDAEEALLPVTTLRNTLLLIVGLTLTLSVGAALFTLALGERASRALLRAKEELEDRVEQRTREVQEQRDLIKAVMDSMTVGVVAFDKDLKLIAWNDKYLEVRGYPQDLIYEGAAFEDLTRFDVENHEFGHEDPEKTFIDTVETARQFNAHSFERQRPDGRYIEVRGGPITGGGFVSIFSDITDRKKTERALNMALEENKRQTERFRNLTNNLPAMVFQFMALGPEQIHITYVSPFMRETFEFGDADENELTEIFYDRLHGDDDEQMREAFSEVIATNGFFNETFRIRQTNGKVRWLEAAARCYDVKGGGVQWDGLILDITDRKLAEEALRESEQQNRLILDSAGEGVFGLDEHGVTTFVNPAACRMLGFSPEDLIGQPMHALIHHTYPDGSAYPSEQCYMRKAFVDGEIHRVNDEVLWRHDGTSFPVEYTSTPIRNDGDLLGAVVTFNDVTERKAAEEALRESQQLLQGVIENSAAVIFFKDKNGVYQLVNRRWEEITGVLRENTIGKTDFDVFPKDIAEQFWNNDLNVIRRSELIESEERVPMEEGERIFLSLKFPLVNADGTVEGICGMSTDITDRKNAEQAIKESEERLRFSLAAMGAYYWVDDLVAGTAVYDSPQFFTQYGYTEDEIPLSIEDYISMIHPDDIPATMESFQAHMDAKTPLHHAEFRMRRKDGTWAWTMNVGRVIEFDDDGKGTKIAGLTLDITDRKRMEAAITEARDKAESATRAKSAFLAAMSHEIRTPMNGVVGMIDLLRETELSTDQAQMMTTVRDSAFALLQIINDILDFSKIEAGKLVLESIPVSVRDVVEGVSETLIPNAQAKQVRFVNFIDPAIPHWVLTDQVRVRQILFNLLGNAVKFTETTDDHQGLVKLRAELVGPIDNDQATVKFSIIDNGIGMSAEAVKNLFKPFTQAESSTTRRFGGTGLGLSICKSLSDMMGGEISVESTPGEGSSFNVTLPFKTDDTRPPPKDEPSLDGLHMLLVSGEDLFFEHIPPYVAGRGGTFDELRDLFSIEQAAAKAAQDGTPYKIVVFGPDFERSMVDAVISALRTNDALGGPRFVIITKDRKAKKGMILPDEVVVDASPMRRSRFLHALGVASGRCSPDVEDSHEKLTAGVAKAPMPDEAAAQGRLILVVEDNKTNQDVIRRQLNALGFACEVADDGKQGLAAWRTGRYGLVLTDCHMPVMDGYSMTKAIRAAESDSGGIDHMPIVAITANALQGEGDRCLETGMDDYLTKPLEMALLKQALAKWMPASLDGELPPTPSEPISENPTESTEPDAAEDTQTAPGSAAVDPAYLRETFGDDQDLINAILKDFPQPAADIVAEIDTALAAKDAVAVGKAGHKLKSSSRAVGADTLADLCYELEQAGKAGDMAKIESLHAQLHPAFEAVVAFIDAL